MIVILDPLKNRKKMHLMRGVSSTILATMYKSPPLVIIAYGGSEQRSKNESDDFLETTEASDFKANNLPCDKMDAPTR